MSKEKYEKAARLSWRLPFGALLGNMLLQAMIKEPSVSLVLGVIFLICCAIGLVNAIIAFKGVATFGKKKILGGAIAGILFSVVLPGSLVALAIPVFHRARDMAQYNELNYLVQQTQMEPHIWDPNNLFRIRSVGVVGPRELQVDHEISQYQLRGDMEAFKQKMKEITRDSYLHDEHMALFRDGEVDVVHRFLEPGGNEVFTIRLEHALLLPYLR